MLSFLKECRKFLNTREKICLVIGNESCDLDSAVCSIALAFFYAKTQPSGPTRFLPILHVPRKQFPIKTEVSYFLRKFQIADDVLVFKDDTTDEFIRNNSVILVDHHVSPYKNSVQEVFDHRPFDSSSDLPISSKKIIEQVGSCATIIGDLILRTTKCNDDLKEVLQLLYGAIVLDTVNFSEEACRATELDLRVAAEIESILEVSNPITHRENLFTELITARKDVSALTAVQLLHKDMKLISNLSGTVKIGIPGYPISVQEFIKKQDAKEAVQEYSNEFGCALVMLIGFKITNGTDIARDIGLINMTTDEKLFNGILEKLQIERNPNLELMEYTDCDFLGGRFFQQRNIRATRKHILPIVKIMLESV